MKSLMLNGIGFVTGDPTLKLNYPFVSHVGFQINASATGDLKWVSMMLPLNKGEIVNGIRITYRNTNVRSFISQIRLVELVSSNTAIVRHDDGTDLLSTVSTTATSAVSNLQVNGSILLMLRLNFGNIADMIEIGAVEIDCQ
jgi:hypothetical protein